MTQRQREVTEVHVRKLTCYCDDAHQVGEGTVRGAQWQGCGRLVLPVLHQLHPLVQLGGSGADEGLGVQHRTWKRKEEDGEEEVKVQQVFFSPIFKQR